MFPRLSLTMIVKNEAATLGRCLTSVYDLVDEMIVVDTGSSDNTKDIASRHGAKVCDFPWCDSFAAARNESIRHASGKWLLWLDADDFLDDANRQKLRTLIEGLPDDHNAYTMQVRCHAAEGSYTLVNHVRLFRNHANIRWDYRIHEQILPSLESTGHHVYFTNIAIDHTGYLDAKLVRQKLERNLRLSHLESAERPNDPFTQYKLGWGLTDFGRYAEAMPQLQSSLQQLDNANPNTPNAYFLLSLCHRHLHQYDHAWAICQTGHLLFPDDHNLLFLKGQLYYERGDRTGARACWSHIFELGLETVADPCTDSDGSLTVTRPMSYGLFRFFNTDLDWSRFLHHLAMLDQEEGRFADAEMHWRTILAQSPSFTPARIGLAELYAKQSRWTELEPLLCDLEPQAPLDASILRSRMELSLKEFTAARKRLEGVITQAPQAVPARLYLTHVLLQEGRDSTAAEQALRQLLALDPSQGDAWHNLATLFQRQGRLPEAITVCHSARVYLPNHPDVQLLLGLLLHQAGDLVNAETTLRQLLEQQMPSTPTANSQLSSMEEASEQALKREVTARHNLALIYRRQRKVADAESQWQAALAMMPDLQAAWIGLGELYLMQGRLAEVESILAHLEDRLPEDEAAALLRPRWHWQRREYREARHQLERIIASKPTACEPLRLLTYVLLEEDRDHVSAESALHELLELAPDDTEARHNLAILHHMRR